MPEQDEMDREFAELMSKAPPKRVKELRCGRLVNIKPQTILEWTHISKGIEHHYRLRYGTPPAGLTQLGVDRSPRFWCTERLKVNGEEGWYPKGAAPLYLLEPLARLAGWKPPTPPAEDEKEEA